ncbi:hypothetical protein TNCV_850161 [Trichonephila clavipes]|uniref:Uncharacterized protein n=1 Tax=Trichonephila clavipes TaxID=2585209 RepID=A0A8X6RYB5_TRICX|nr:hypothetical protein TNCV_850161 [Trichonephila clavipes]
MKIWIGRDIELSVVETEKESAFYFLDTHSINYTRAFGDRPRNFEPWPSDVTTPKMAPPLLTTSPHQREDVSALDRFNVHRCPTRWVFSGTRLELLTRQANDPIPIPLGYIGRHFLKVAFYSNMRPNGDDFDPKSDCRKVSTLRKIQHGGPKPDFVVLRYATDWDTYERRKIDEQKHTIQTQKNIDFITNDDASIEQKGSAAFHSRRISISGESLTSFPEDTSMLYLGFELEPIRLQAEITQITCLSNDK